MTSSSTPSLILSWKWAPKHTLVHTFTATLLTRTKRWQQPNTYQRMKDKQSMIPPSKKCYSATEGCSLTQATGGTSNTAVSVKEPDTQYHTLMILFTWNEISKKKKRNEISRTDKSRDQEGEWLENANGCGVSFWSDNIWELVTGGIGTSYWW